MWILKIQQIKIIHNHSAQINNRKLWIMWITLLKKFRWVENQLFKQVFTDFIYVTGTHSY